MVRLINDDASKDGIVAAWEGLVAKAKAGDTIVFSYAGHGGQEPEPKGRHDEADGLNEIFSPRPLYPGWASDARAHSRR